jgi:hypothetical protein
MTHQCPICDLWEDLLARLILRREFAWGYEADRIDKEIARYKKYLAEQHEGDA